jgi:gluconolactonase
MTFILPVAALLLAAELPADDAVKAVEVARVPTYCEGIVFDHDGNGYVSHDRFITRVAPDGTTSTWAEPGGPNGHKVLADGTHVVCNFTPKDPAMTAMLLYGPDGKLLRKLSTECDGKPLRGPNDLSLDVPNGGFYFTDPGGSSKEKPIGTVHYVTRDGKTLLVAEGLAFPNGIVLTPDGKTLLLAESQKNRVLSYPVLEAGKVGPPKVYCDLPTKSGEQIDNQPDGMCLDAAGNLYVAHYGMRQVQVVGPTGKVIRRYPGGNLTTSNVAFGGPDMATLYVTGGIGKENESGPGVRNGGLFKLELPGVKGLVILPKKKS